MRNLVPLTKIILTLGTAVWAIVLQKPESLLLLCLFEILILLVSGELFRSIKALVMLTVFAAFLGLIEKIGGGSNVESVVAALRMLGMTIIFIYLLGTVRLQDLTAAMVQLMNMRSCLRPDFVSFLTLWMKTGPLQKRRHAAGFLSKEISSSRLKDTCPLSVL